jgi:hypothetical protein
VRRRWWTEIFRIVSTKALALLAVEVASTRLESKSIAMRVVDEHDPTAARVAPVRVAALDLGGSCLVAEDPEANSAA